MLYMFIAQQTCKETNLIKTNFKSYKLFIQAMTESLKAKEIW